MSDYHKILIQTLNYSKDNQYKGYNKYDALDSTLLNKISFGNKYLRLIYSQAIMRSPVNIRPMFRVPKTINPKGIALFAMAYLNLYKFTQEEEYLDEARTLLTWLTENSCLFNGSNCWGYQYPWQDVGFFAKPNLPNRVVTYFVVSAFMDAYEITGEETYLSIASDSIPFFIDAPKILYDDETMRCMSYVPVEEINWVVMDVSALTASIITRINKYNDNERIARIAKKLIHYVVDKQTDNGAWYYTHPPGMKRIDNYHTGYILDAILDFMNHTNDKSYLYNYSLGLDFYKNNLFLDSGAPKWYANKIYPFDVHGSAQGVITLIKSAKHFPENEGSKNSAKKIVDWTIENLFNDKKGYFYYQKSRYYKKRFTLMRWCNAWMARALSELIGIK
jgi:hypothetical protein